MKAFHNDGEVKKFYLDRLKAHFKADEIVKGKYWENGKGCAVGCTVHSSNHSDYESKLGIPQIIAKLEDRIFENLPNNLAKTWPLRFLESITTGADLSLVWAKFASRLLTDPVGGVIQYAKTEEQLEVIQGVSDLYEGQIQGIEIPEEIWIESKNAPYAAAFADAAYNAAAVAAAYAAAVSASASANSAASASAYAAAAYAAAAFADADASAADAARTKAYICQSKLLLELLKEAKGD